MVFNGEQPEKESSIRVRMASLVIPNGDHRDGFFFFIPPSYSWWILILYLKLQITQFENGSIDIELLTVDCNISAISKVLEMLLVVIGEQQM